MSTIDNNGTKHDNDNPAFFLHQKPFSERVREGYEHFLKGEATLRRLIDERAESEVITEQLEKLLSPVFNEVYAEVGFNGEKYDLILNLEGNWSRLFSLVYFQKHAPREVLTHWNILVGRRAREEALANYQLYMYGETLKAEELQLWTLWEEDTVKVSIYCEKLLPLLQKERGMAYWISYIMLDQAIGELAEMKYINEIELLETPYSENRLTITHLLPQFMEQLSLTKEELFDADRYCELYNVYQMQPNEEADDGLRGDVFVGSTCFVSLLNDFWRGENNMMDSLHKDGIVAGYFCYPLYGFEGENRGAKILDFRDNMVAALEEQAGCDAFTFIGGANGIYYGYIDFIAWDFNAVIDAAVSIFEKSGLDYAMFHSFRRDVDGVTLFEK